MENQRQFLRLFKNLDCYIYINIAQIYLIVIDIY